MTTANCPLSFAGQWQWQWVSKHIPYELPFAVVVLAGDNEAWRNSVCYYIVLWATSSRACFQTIMKILEKLQNMKRWERKRRRKRNTSCCIQWCFQWDNFKSTELHLNKFAKTPPDLITERKIYCFTFEKIRTIGQKVIIVIIVELLLAKQTAKMKQNNFNRVDASE